MYRLHGHMCMAQHQMYLKCLEEKEAVEKAEILNFAKGIQSEQQLTNGEGNMLDPSSPHYIQNFAHLRQISRVPTHEEVSQRGWHAYLMMGSGRLPEGRSEGVSPRMEAGEPLESRLNRKNEVNMSHGHSRQDSDYPACWPVLAWSTWCKRRASAQEAAQQSLDASVSLMIVHD